MKLSQVDLNLLVTLDAIIKERSVTRAGRTVGLSQPAMSAALNRLRNLFNDPLLERAGRDYRLTPRALQLAEPVQSILLAVERTLDHGSSFEPSSSERSFRIAGSDYAACVLFQPLVQHLSRTAPGVQLRLQRAGTATARHLSARDIDLSVQPDATHRDFTCEPLWSDQFVCVVWRGNACVGEQLTKEQLFSLGHVTYSHAPYGFTLADHFLGSVARELRVQVMTDSFVNLPFLLRGTNLVALLQTRLAVQLMHAADIRILPCPVPVAPLQFSMWWNPLYDNDPAHTWLRATLAQVARETGLERTDAPAPALPSAAPARDSPQRPLNVGVRFSRNA